MPSCLVLFAEQMKRKDEINIKCATRLTNAAGVDTVGANMANSLL